MCVCVTVCSVCCRSTRTDTKLPHTAAELYKHESYVLSSCSELAGYRYKYTLCTGLLTQVSHPWASPSGYNYTQCKRTQPNFSRKSTCTKNFTVTRYIPKSECFKRQFQLSAFLTQASGNSVGEPHSLHCLRSKAPRQSCSSDADPNNCRIYESQCVGHRRLLGTTNTLREGDISVCKRHAAIWTAV